MSNHELQLSRARRRLVLAIEAGTRATQHVLNIIQRAHQLEERVRALHERRVLFNRKLDARLARCGQQLDQLQRRRRRALAITKKIEGARTALHALEAQSRDQEETNN